MTTHRIRITSAPGGYVTVGAVAIHAVANPMKAAAQALLEAGRDPADRLQGVFEGAQISPARLDAIVRPRKIPKTDHRSASASRNVD